MPKKLMIEAALLTIGATIAATALAQTYTMPADTP